MAALLTIDGVELPTPSDYKVSLQGLDKADRNANGNLIKEHINDKVKIELGWKVLSAAKLASVFTAVKGNFFQVTYLHPETNEYRTGTFYAGDRSAGMIDFQNSVPRYSDVKFNIIEK